MIGFFFCSYVQALELALDGWMDIVVSVHYKDDFRQQYKGCHASISFGERSHSSFRRKRSVDINSCLKGLGMMIVTSIVFR